MNSLRSFLLVAGIGFFSLGSVQAQSVAPLPAQASAPMQEQADSLQRSLLQDSLGLSSSIATQFLALRDSSLVRSERLQANSALTPRQRNKQLQTMRWEIIASMRELVGALNYNRYLELLSAQ